VQRQQLGLSNDMAYASPRLGSLFLAVCLLLLILPAPVAAFGAGNIPSIAEIEGKNFRHGGNDCLSRYY
jgi:Heterokaryon incompatibility protein Het-C